MTATNHATATGATTEPPRRRLAVSVRTRITAAVALLTGLALGGAGLVVYALESARINESVVEQVQQELAEFTALRDGVDPDTGRRFTDVRRLIRLFLERNVPDDDELLVGYWNGAPQIGSGTRHVEEFRDYPPFLALIERRLGSGGTERLDTDRWGEVVVTVQPVSDGERNGAFVIASFVNDEHLEINRTMRTYAVVALLSLGVITAAGAWQAGRLLRPLRTLRESAEEVTGTDLSRRIPETGNDDITALTRTFNAMLERLDRAFTDQRQFLDDAGHELRTPLTILQGHMELVDPTDAEEVRSTRTLLLDEVDRMARLVNDLIMLAKADRPDFVRTAPVDVAALTETVLEKSRALGDRRWLLEENTDLVARLDEQRLTQALVQLAQNAVKHTGRGDEIAIGARQRGEDCLELWVRDTGPGVADEDKPVIFDRFARGAGAQHEVGHEEGFGLGLSIVHAIALAHGGTVRVEDAVPSGARFVLRLPLDGALRRKDEAWRAS